MKDLLIDYSNNHEDISQPLIFWPSVMILLLSVVGIMWSLETPFAFSDVSPILNWGILFLMVMTVYCFLISFVLAIGLIPFFTSTIMLFLWLENLGYSIMYISIYGITFSLYGIYRGRRIQNNLRSVIEDLQNHKSPLQKTAKNLVVYDGNLNAKVMLIGEAPGRDEDEQGIPFVGRAGQLLNKMLLAINLQREDVYITNVVNWRPAENRTPNDDEILEFLPFLQRQIDIIKPRFIFLLGGVAAKAILSTPLALGKLRGKWHEYKSLNLEEGIPTIASYHPAFLLRSPQYKKHSWEDLQMLQEKLKNES